MFGWSREIGERIFVGKNNEYLYVMREDRQNLHFLRAFVAMFQKVLHFFLLDCGIFNQTLPTRTKYRHGIF